MAIRIVYWNINNFSLPKVAATAPWWQVANAADRRSLIINQVLTQVAAGDPAPDLIAIVEVYSRVREVGVEGTVLNSGGSTGRGVLNLLAGLRAAPMGAAAAIPWALVPPINLGDGGKREAVTVFYNPNTLQFTGPNFWYRRWAGANIGQSQPVNGAIAVAPNILNYPTTWKNGMPWPGNPLAALQMNRTTNFPNGAAVITLPERQLAGQWEWYNGVRPYPSPDVQPPFPPNRVQYPDGGCRGPYYTRFTEVATGRTISLYTVHTSPSSARQAVLRMAATPEITAAPAATEVKVLLGDFNVDTYSANSWVYNLLNNVAVGGTVNYVMQLDPRQAHAGPGVPERKPYLMTHILPTTDATPFNDVGLAAPDVTHNVYPRFGYMGSSWPQLNDSGAIDNVFTWYGAGAAAPPASNMTIVNLVVGSPYSAGNPAPAPIADLVGGYTYPARMVTGIPLPAGENPAAVVPAAFPLWGNYDRIRNTSDHLPLTLLV